ncbi:hypothetical protein [Anaerosporobacter sp.]|uniref:hypothetical protein n=1 Tax=Anaerosporobacter sp. TaxID=1872529 RepID=UPI00286F05B8|nr:hypothetical protein [Anaerosporobacter sp.]
MKIYLLENEEIAKQLCQLLKLNAECAKLHWSCSIKDISNEVINSLTNIETFVENKVFEVCTSENLFSELTKQEEEDLMCTIKEKPELRKIVGTGVILHGKQAEEVNGMLKNNKRVDKLIKAIDSKKNIVIF